MSRHVTTPQVRPPWLLVHSWAFQFVDVAQTSIDGLHLIVDLDGVKVPGALAGACVNQHTAYVRYPFACTPMYSIHFNVQYRFQSTASVILSLRAKVRGTLASAESWPQRSPRQTSLQWAQ